MRLVYLMAFVFLQFAMTGGRLFGSENMKINLKDCDAFDLFLFVYFAMIIAFIFFAGYMLTKHGLDYSYPTTQAQNRGQRCRAVMVGKVATVHCKRQDNEN